MLPSPRLGNTTECAVDTKIRNATDGTLYSYNKTNSRRKLVWDFDLRRGKAEELKAFLESYFGIQWRATDWAERVYKVYLVNNPLDFTYVTKGGLTVVKLELEGELINA